MLDGLDQNERGLRQAKDLFDLVERPVITIETADIAQGRDGKRNIYITLVNSGRTIATDVEMQMQTFRREPSANNNDPCPDPAPEWDFADPAGVKARDTVGVNATRVLKADEFSTQQLKDLHERVYELFIRLECKYASASGEKKYKYEWYAKWDPYQVKFSSCQCNNIAT